MPKRQDRRRAAAVTLIRWKLNPAWMIALGAVVGLLVHAG